MTQKQIEKANVLRDSGKTKEAIKILTPILKAKDFKVMTNAHIALGICYTNEKKYEKAIELYKKAIAICEKNKWLPRIGGIARDMAIAYKNAKKFSEAEEWMLKSLALIKEYYDEGRGMNASLGIGYSKLGLIYTEAKKYPKAERVFTISQKYLKAGNHEYWKLIGAIDYCYYLSARKDYKKAKGILQKVITEGIRQEKEYKLIETFILAGDTEMGLGNKDGAKMFYSMAKLSITKIFDSPEVRGKFQSQIESRIKS